jgi:hypothetical protein
VHHLIQTPQPVYHPSSHPSPTILLEITHERILVNSIW